MFELLARSGLFSEGYGTIIIVVPCNSITSSSVINFLNQNTSLVASEVTMYSASIVESAMIDYLKLFQLTDPPLHKKIHHDVDFLSSTSVIKSELVYPSTFSSDPPLKIKNKFLVLLKYLRMFFTVIQCSSSRFT